jgi:hypothetical protein
MGRNVLFVGSVPLDSVEEVMSTLAQNFGHELQALPDGEVGERRSWVNRLCYQVFNGHVDLETVKRPKPVDGVEQLLPRDRADAWQFKVRPGVERVRFGNPGYRLGYAKDSANSYFVFRTLREKGVIPPGVRFQVSIPMVNSVVRPLYFPAPADLPRIRPGYEEALAAEIDAMLRRIQHEDLAIQWDCAWEVAAVHEGAPGAPQEQEIATHTAPIGRLSRLLPEAVDLGFHFCFGTFGGWPRFAPDDLGRTVELVNAAVAATGRRVDWVHIPALERTDQAFYAPLANLEPQGARVYLGMVHSMPSLKQRLEVASKYVPDFGLAAYCGFGRLPPAEVPALLDDHRKALDMAGLSTAKSA